MRYIVGIDLGTTNSALAFIDLEHPALPLQIFTIPQLSFPGKIDNLSTLPSFCYLSSKEEWPKAALLLPWRESQRKLVGKFAKLQGAKIPTKLVESAKSWLCNQLINRRDKILPVEAADSEDRVSPVEASSFYLTHLKNAWNHLIAKGNPSLELEEQTIILTVPASFDETARTLTLEAAYLAGFRHVTLLEEPQAAFYSWISRDEQSFQQKFQIGERILICDVGGGTTDFSLIEIEKSQEGEMRFSRQAVGDHLLLGGDNIDIALAHLLEKKLVEKGKKELNAVQWLQLKAAAREAKEALLIDPFSEVEANHTVVIQSHGASVIKESLSLSVNASEVKDFILQGFFGSYSWDEAVLIQKSQGFKTMGLPYENEPSMIKHLAYFLKHLDKETSSKGVDYVLFNGGTMKPKIFQEAVLKNLQSWFPQKKIEILESFSFDLAVARGAAYYGKTQKGLGGITIKGGIPRNYYLRIDRENGASNQALTLLAKGAEEGHSYSPSQAFSLRANSAVVFQVFTSHTRLKDKEGEIVEIDDQEFQKLPSIETILKFGKKTNSTDSHRKILVGLEIKCTPIGTVEIWLKSKESDHQWKLEFQIRSALGQDNEGRLLVETKRKDEIFEATYLDGAKNIIEQICQGFIKPANAFQRLEGELQASRHEWSPSTVRILFDHLMKYFPQKFTSIELACRLWNLAGFLMRPGFGYALDDFRIKELWKLILRDYSQVKDLNLKIQFWICFRRIAGGLSKGQQTQLANEMLGDLFTKKSSKTLSKKNSDSYLYTEKIRTLSSFERLSLHLKERIARMLIDKITSENAVEADYSALGRIGARHLFYGAISQVIPIETTCQWIQTLLKSPFFRGERPLALLLQIARKTEHREINLPESIYTSIFEIFESVDFQKRLLEKHVLSTQEQEEIFGESLPAGLVILNSATD